VGQNAAIAVTARKNYDWSVLRLIAVSASRHSTGQPFRSNIKQFTIRPHQSFKGQAFYALDEIVSLQ
jgi:hypothetical protein